MSTDDKKRTALRHAAVHKINEKFIFKVLYLILNSVWM